MLETNLNGNGNSGFRSQKAPSFYDLDQLERLFKYITKVIPCAIIESKLLGTYAGESLARTPTKHIGERVIKKDEKTYKTLKLQEINESLELKGGKDFLSLITEFNKWYKDGEKANGKSHLYQGKKHTPHYLLETEEAKKKLGEIMAKLRISRVHIDPDPKHTLTAQSSGGDVPPPKYPPN